MSAVKCFLITLALIGLGYSARADETVQRPPKIMSEDELKPVENIFLQMGSEREKLLQYVCDVDVTISPNSKESPKIPFTSEETGNLKGYQLHFEYSKLEGYRLCYARQNPKQTIKYLSGHTRENDIVFEQSEGIQLLDADFRDRANVPLNVPGYFDPRAVGLGFFGDHATGSSFEEILHNHVTNWCSGYLRVKRTKVGDDSIQLKNADTVIVIDTKHGFWPSSLEYNDSSNRQPKPTKWRVDTGKVSGDMYLPIRATLIYGKPGAIILEQEFYFDWKEVNQKGLSAFDSVKKISAENGISFKDLRTR